MKIINIASEFSEFPVGRFYADGPDSGERFRDELLEPALRDGGIVTVLLSGTEGYGSSFLDEAFGGVVRKLRLTQEEANARIILQASPEDESFVKETLGYIQDACRSSHA
jgi:hypothetical protein